MFVVYAVPIGVLVGLLRRGRLENLAGLRFEWPLVAIGALAVQLALFSPAVGAYVASVGMLGPILYVGSALVVLAVVLRNRRLPGLKLVALGAISNLVAIIANGGYMPADPGALALAGLDPTTGFSNSIVTNQPAFRPLTDLFALPDWMPFANVFSVGDVLIGLGIVVAIAAGMSRPRVEERAPAGSAAADGPAPVTSGNSPD